MKAQEHGGNIWQMAQLSQRRPEDIVDFSVNVRPEGPAPFLLQALQKAINYAAPYPSPYAEEARQAAASFYGHYGHSQDAFVFGNGSNELIHMAARFFAAQGYTQACIIEPAFSEYALAARHAGLPVQRLWGGLKPGEVCLATALQKIAARSLVFLANPANPSGLLQSKEALLQLMAQRADLMWIIDEAFIEYAMEDASIISDLPKNALILRSLTKFHALAGVRLGFLVAHAELATALRGCMPAWSVNCFALQAALAVFQDTSAYATQTREENVRRREHLVAQLQAIDGMEVFPSAANYVLFRHGYLPKNTASLLLKKYGMALRDCSNYYGLEDKTWYRAAVRFEHEHVALGQALRKLLPECT